MIKKITREVCLAKYRKFPLAPYDPNTDEEVYFFPKVYRGDWYELGIKTAGKFDRILARELIKLITACNILSLIFLGDKNMPWRFRSPHPKANNIRLKKASDYFKANKLVGEFNGGVEIQLPDLIDFTEHFYCITRSFASFHGFYFMDPSENLLGCIHYKGDIQFLRLNKKFEPVFTEALKKTGFSKK